MNIIIKKLDFDNLDSAVRLCNQVREYHINLLNGYFKPQDDEFEKHNLSKMVGDIGSINLISLADEKVVGLLFAECKNARYLIKQNVYNIHNFVVDEKYRKHGLGKMLMDEFCKIAKELKVDEVRLSVYTDNKTAIEFYERYGFRMLEQKMTLNL